MKAHLFPVALLALASRAVADEPAALAWKFAEGDAFELHMSWSGELGAEGKKTIVKRDFKGSLLVGKPADDGTPLMVLSFLSLGNPLFLPGRHNPGGGRQGRRGRGPRQLQAAQGSVA